MNYLQITSGNIRQIQFKPHTIRNEVLMKLIYIHSIKFLLFVAKYVEPAVIFIIVYICGAFICAEVQAARGDVVKFEKKTVKMSVLISMQRLMN